MNIGAQQVYELKSISGDHYQRLDHKMGNRNLAQISVSSFLISEISSLSLSSMNIASSDIERKDGRKDRKSHILRWLHLLKRK